MQYASPGTPINLTIIMKEAHGFESSIEMFQPFVGNYCRILNLPTFRLILSMVYIYLNWTGLDCKIV